MAEEDVGGIALEFNVDTTGFSAGIARMREELNGLKAQAGKIELGVVSATRGVGGVSRQTGGGGAVFAGGGYPGGTAPSPLVSPKFQVSAGSVRNLRTDINAQMRQLASAGEAVTVSIKLGRVPYAAIRNEISQGIGDVTIRGLQISPAAIAGALRQVSAAVVAQSSGAAGIPHRATGGPIYGPTIVGERRPELFIPSGPGRIMPYVPHAERGSRVAYTNLTNRQANFTGNLRAAARQLEPRHIQGGLDWYTDAGRYGRAQADKYGVDHERALGVLAALSAGTAWSSNKTKYERVLRAHASGQPFPYQMGLDAHRKAEAILSGRMTPKQAFSTSPKVGQFYDGLSGDLDSLTIDRWAARTASRGALDQPGRGRGRTRMERSWKKVAAETGMQNAPFQAALWLLEKEGGVARAGGGPVDDFEKFQRSFGMPPVEHGASSRFMRRGQLRGTHELSRDRIRGLYEPYNQPKATWWELKQAGIDPSTISKNARGGGVRSRRPGQWGQHGTADREWLSTLGGWGGNTKYNKPDWDEALDPEYLTRYRGDPHDKGPGSGHVYTDAMDPVMYHVTHRDNMDRILSEGVQPQKSGINRYGSLNDRKVGTYWSRYPDAGWAGGDPVALATRLSNIHKPESDEIGDLVSKKGVAPEHLMFLAADKRLRHLARGGAAMRGAGFVPGLRSIAQAYNRSAGLPRMQEHMLHPLDADFSTRTALAYEGLRGGSSALDRRAYRAFAEETGAQYEHLQRAGFSFTGSLDDPYSEPSRLTKMQQAARDVHRNKHLFAFGSALEHPLLSNEENLRFRHVHDMMGHLTEGFSIGPRGEYNAAVKHSQMYSPLARRAMLAETHGQNSVVNFSPTIHPAFGRSIADVNREHPGSIYADQKSRALPDDIMEEFYARTGIHRYRGGPALKDVFPGGVNLSAMPRKRRLEAGQALYALGREFPYAASRLTGVRAVPDWLMSSHVGITKKRYDEGEGRRIAAGAVDDITENGSPMGRPVMRLNAQMTDAEIAKLGTVSKTLFEVATHEFGHVIDFTQNASGRHRGMLQRMELPSVYAGLNKYENFAEHFLHNRKFGHGGEGIWAQTRRIDNELFEQSKHRAKGGPAHRGGVPKGMRVEFYEPGSGEKITGNRIKELFGHKGPPGMDGADEAILNAYIRDKKTGRIVGSSPFSYDHDTDALHPEMTFVDPGYRRRGLATAMYVKAERLTGRRVEPSGAQTPFGRALWSGDNRPFGKGFEGRRISNMDRQIIHDEQARIRRFQKLQANPFGLRSLVDLLRQSLKAEDPDYKEDVYLTKPEPKQITAYTPEGIPYFKDAPLHLSSNGMMADAGRIGRPSLKETRLRNQELIELREKKAQAKWAAKSPEERGAWLGQRAAGGNAGQGLYIVNELGREVFVPKSHESSIPTDVAAQLPGGGGLAARLARARGEVAPDTRPVWLQRGSSKDLTGRAVGGPVEINGVGPMLWQAPEDGWIIPNRLKNKIHHRAGGGEVDMSSGSGFESGMAADATARHERLTRRTDAELATFEARLAEARRTREARLRGRNLRQEIYQSLPQDLAPGGFDPSIVNARIAQGANRGLTGRAAAGGAAAFFLGGGEKRRRALAEAQAVGREYTRLAPERGRDTIEGLNEQIVRLEDHSADLQKQMGLIDKSTASGTTNWEHLNKELRKTEIVTHGVSDRLHTANELQVRQSKALEAAQGGAVANFAAVTAAGFAFNIGMTAVSDALSLGAKAAAPLVDQLTGFTATSQRTTGDLAKQLPEAGTVPTLFARAGTSAGLSSQATDFLQKVLGPAVTAKAGANAAGQASDLFRAALGAGAPSGLLGGTGGVLGSGFLGSELGGQKGFAETISGDVAASKGKPASAGLAGDLIDNLGKGFDAASRELRNEFRDTLGGLGVNVNSKENVLNPTSTITPEQERVQKEILSNFNEAAGRGARSQGQAGAATLSDVGVGSKEATQVLGIQGIDDYTKQLANAGVVFKDTAGKVLTSVTDINKAYATASLGFTLPDAQTFAAQSAQQLTASEQAGAAKGEVTRGVEIPGQLGQQLAANPFAPVMSGLADVSKLSAKARSDLTATGNLQAKLTEDGKAGIEQQAQLIAQNVSGPAAQQFKSYMQDVSNYGQAITDINAALADRQAAAGKVQYLNQIRLIDRGIQDARGLLKQPGGSNVGRLERKQFDLSRESQQLGFASATLQRAADSLSLQLNQRQINFQTAIAGFQAPGITGEERAARIAEAKLEASYAQKQQNISVQQYGIGGQQLGISKEQYGVEGQLFTAQAQRQLDDLSRQKAIAEEQYAIEQEQIAAQKRIAVLTVTQAQLQAKAQSLFGEATGNFDARLGAAAQYAGQFGGTMAAAIDAVRRAIVRLNSINPQTSTTEQQPGKTKDDRVHATGGAFITNGPTRATYGEAGTEMGIFLRGPKPLQLGAMGLGGGGGAGGGIIVHVDVHDNQVRNDDDIEQLTRKVTEGVKTALSREASLLGIAS